jgi:tRNA(His) 5'-end guanylyltransferase
MTKDSLGDRMKEYESVPRTSLLPHVPVMMRLDGKAFHTFTRSLRKPYDVAFHKCMWQAAKALCEQVQGCKLAYVQSDEISLLLTDWDDLTTQPWFGYGTQKMCSIAAAICTAAFNKAMTTEGIKTDSWALFDCRVWNVPDHEVENVFIWRQQDAIRNSIQMLAQANFSHKRLQGLDCTTLQEILKTEKNIDWSMTPTPQQRGVCLTRVLSTTTVAEALGPDKLVSLGTKIKDPEAMVTRATWEVDLDIPVFTSDREYITQRLPMR